MVYNSPKINHHEKGLNSIRPSVSTQHHLWKLTIHPRPSKSLRPSLPLALRSLSVHWTSGQHSRLSPHLGFLGAVAMVTGRHLGKKEKGCVLNWAEPANVTGSKDCHCECNDEVGSEKGRGSIYLWNIKNVLVTGAPNWKSIGTKTLVWMSSCVTSVVPFFTE